MPGDEPVYVDAVPPVVARCIRCNTNVAGSRSGAHDARYVIKALKEHNDLAHSDWRPNFPADISAGIAAINAGAVSSGHLSGGRFEVYRSGSQRATAPNRRR